MTSNLLEQQGSKDELREVYHRLYRSPRYYSELLLKIRTKEAQIEPLFYNKAQRYVYQRVQRMRKEGKPIRIIVPKARQVGISTGISSIIYHYTVTRSNINSMISSHDQDSSENIYRMYKLFYDKTDAMFKPMTKYSNKKEILFENPDEQTRAQAPGLNSRIMVETAQNTSLGRSFTLQMFHGSEVAYWKNAKEVMLGVEEAVPYKPGTLIALESTGNGVGDYFHKKCEQAAQHKGKYELIFVPWFWDDEYSVHDPKRPLGELGDHDKAEYGNEKVLVEKFRVTEDQLRWRRAKIEDEFDGSLEKFSQEYPSTWREAFIFSGQPLFPVKTLIYMKEAVKPVLTQGHITWDKDHVFSVKESRYGNLKVWEEPVKDEVYTIGADVSEGVEGGDNSVIEVLRVRTMEQVAEWCGLTQPEDLAFMIFYLGGLYNKALVGVEVNNHGLTTVVTLQNLRYWNQYRRIVFDKVSRKRRDALGWKTTSITKPLMIDGLRQQVKQGEILLNSIACIDEMLHYAKLENGTMGATAGNHDDRVIALAIANEMAKQSHVQAQVKPELSLKPKLTYAMLDRMAEEIELGKNKIPLIGGYGG